MHTNHAVQPAATVHPCPQSISLGTCLSYYNLYKYMHMETAKKMFLENQWNDTCRLDRCTSYGSCEKTVSESVTA